MKKQKVAYELENLPSAKVITIFNPLNKLSKGISSDQLPLDKFNALNNDKNEDEDPLLMLFYQQISE